MNTTAGSDGRSAGGGAGAESLASQLKAQAYGVGFDLAGIATLGPADTASHFDEWLGHGYAGTMEYMERHTELRRDSRLPQPGMRSALVVGLNYGGTQPTGPIARYARGDDYHRLMWDRLESLGTWLTTQAGGSSRAFVDTGPVLERDLARRAGLGWFGKNTLLINPGLGSFFFIGALFTDLELQPDAPFEEDRCGTCRKCLDACPTNALVAPRALDSTQCVSYLTIELRDAIPETLRLKIGDLLYGCDICQDVCPWNISFARELTEPAFAPRAALDNKDARSLARELLGMDEETYRATFRNSAMKRAKLGGLKRNAAVVLGNVGDARDTALLSEALTDAAPLVPEHAAWAIAQIAARTPNR
ncbi:MAG: tRNA epoxyqueuosine(34) reductase QueG [Gemmatimonadetes bacterium]|nr:MAG: tRNA epoxyqueuosine(34) reductase QueG [Gemmatimonadota bacterium]PHX96514.1 MAG: tRNA epoxyqueuosine(34) reductase QueG [Gemmatimonadota bacterium]